MIEGVKVKKLKVIPDDRGRLMEIFRCDDAMFSTFGQVYFTTAFPGIVKAWHFHKLQDDNFTCVSGRIKLGLYDARENSPTEGKTETYYLSVDEPKLVHIPKGVYHGFKCVSEQEAMVINTVTKPYNHQDPDEHRIDYQDPNINYNWDED